MAEKIMRAKRELTRAEWCKIFSYMSVAHDTIGNVASDIASIEGANLVAAPIAAGSHLNKGITDAAMIAMDCSSIPFEEIKQILNKRFNEIDKKLDKGAEALESVSKLVDKTYYTVEKLRIEMREGFKRVIETIENETTKQIVTDINKIVQFFGSEKENINNRQKEDYVTKLEESGSGNFLLYLRRLRTSEEGSMHTLLFKIINQKSAIPKNAEDDNAIRALYALFYGTQTYISIMFYLVKQYSYLADYHYQNGDLSKFNANFDHMKTVFQDFKFSLNGIKNQNSKPLIDTVTDILETVKSKTFIRNLRNNLYRDILKRTETLLDLKKEIAAMELPIIDDIPKSSISLDFKEEIDTIVHVKTPILKWNLGTEVKYAIQYEYQGKYSKISKWSNPVTIQELANPFITIDKDKRNRLVFRQFGNEPPELVSILSGSQNEFRDIHRDLYNAALMPYKKTAFSICQKLIQSGAEVSAGFEMGRKAIHAAASVGNDNVASLLLKENSYLLNVADKNGYTPLHIAADRKRNDYVKLLLEKGADVNARTSSDLLTPLHLAARRDFTLIIKTLMGNKNIDLNAREHAGFTPLHVSINSNFRAARTLVKTTDADVNIKSNFGLTPLHLAVLQNNLRVVRILARSSKGVKLNEGDSNDMTALHYAAMTGNLSVTMFLLKLNGINVNALTKGKKWTPLHLAIIFKKFDVAERLLMDKNLDVSMTADGDITPLHVAAATGRKQLVRDILDEGADINKKTIKGLTALHLSIMNRNEETQLFLLEKGANIDAKTNFGVTPLHLAASLGNVNILNILINKGADIKALDINYQMPIHEAVINGHLPIVKILIERDPSLKDAINIRNEYPFYLAVEKRYKDIFDYFVGKGADVNEADTDGNTLLHHFSRNGDVEVVQFLIQNGANLRLRNKKGKSFFDLAIENGRLEIVKYAVDDKKVDVQEEINGRKILHSSLCNAVRAGKTEVVKYFVDTLNVSECHPLHVAAEYAHLDLVKYFVQERGMHPDKYNEDMEVTPLCLASRGSSCGVLVSCDTPERLEVVKYLAGKVHDINQECDTEKGTPLLHAVFGNKKSILNYLVTIGADPNKNVRGDPPLFTAALVGRYEMVRSLVEEHKVDVNTRNKDKFTPLHAAARNDHIDVVKYLVSKGADVNAVAIENVKPIDLAGEKSRAYLQSFGKRFFHRGIPHKSHSIENSNIVPERMNHVSTFRQQLSVSQPRLKSDFNTTEEHSGSIQVRSVDVNGVLLLLDLMIRVFTNQKLNYAASGSGLNTRSTAEAQAEALKIAEKFEYLLNELNERETFESVDLSKVHSKIYKAIMRDNRSKISEMLCSYVEKYSKLSPGEIEKLLPEFEPLASAVLFKLQTGEYVPNILSEACGLNTNSYVPQIK